jgi:hypothetical protein
MADPEFFILKEWAWMDTTQFEDIILGGFVKNYADPIAAYVPLEESLVKKYKHEKFSNGSFTDFVANAYGTDKKEATAVLGSLAGISFTGEKEEAINLSGKFVRFKRIAQSDDYFEKVKSDSDVTSRVPKWIRSKTETCLVVGVMVCEDVEVEWTSEEKRDAEGHVTAPVGTIALAAGAPLPPGTNIDPQLKLSGNKVTGRVFKAKSGTSKIFAVQLREVTNGKWLKRKELDLKDNGPSIEKGRKLDGEAGDGNDSIPDEELFLV